MEAQVDGHASRAQAAPGLRSLVARRHRLPARARARVRATAGQARPARPARHLMVPRLGVMPPLSPGIYTRPRADRIPFPLNEPGCVLFERARHGLWHGLRALGLGYDDEVL